MANYSPTPKVAAGTAAGAVTIVLVWVASLLGLDVPTEVAQAVTILIGFGVAYLVPDASTNAAGRHEAVAGDGEGGPAGS